MEHSGAAMKGGSTEGNGGPSATLRGGDTKGERSSAADHHSGSMGKSASSDEKMGKTDRQQANDKKAKSDDRQANDNDRNLKNETSKDRADRSDGKSTDQARDNSKPDKATNGASEGTEGKNHAKGELTGISSEQKTKVISAFGGHRVAPARDIGVAVNVGVVVPRSVHFYPMPEEIVTIVPDYRGYEYFMIDDSHVAIVDPDSLEVVDVIVVT
jgi:hypothetical protein